MEAVSNPFKKKKKPNLAKSASTKVNINRFLNNLRNEFFSKANIPNRFQSDSFENYDKYNRELEKKVNDFIQSIENISGGEWFFLFGRTGNGKTHLAVAGLRKLIKVYLEHKFQGYRNDPPGRDKFKREIEKIKPFTFIDDEEYFDRVKDNFGTNKSNQMINRIKETPVLVWDDILLDVTPWKLNKIHSVLNYRYNNNKVTILTSNLPIEYFKEIYKVIRDHKDYTKYHKVKGERIASRLEEKCRNRSYYFDFPDYRT